MTPSARLPYPSRFFDLVSYLAGGSALPVWRERAQSDTFAVSRKNLRQSVTCRCVSAKFLRETLVCSD